MEHSGLLWQLLGLMLESGAELELESGLRLGLEPRFQLESGAGLHLGGMRGRLLRLRLELLLNRSLLRPRATSCCPQVQVVVALGVLVHLSQSDSGRTTSPAPSLAEAQCFLHPSCCSTSFRLD